MFLRFSWLLSLLLISAVSLRTLAQSEDERREGFYLHQKSQKAYDLEREKGLKDFLKEEADWEDKRKEDIKADKKRKKTESPMEGGPEYKADRKEKLEDYEESLANRRAYIKEKHSHDAKNAREQAKRDAWAMEEYGLNENRPRFDWAKRNFTGGKGATASSGSGVDFSRPGGYNPPPNNSFPPAPAYDDFSDGYIPPPPPDVFEPPPPEYFPNQPAVPFPAPGGDFDGGYYPPPPPPPPMEDFGSF